MSGPHSPLGSPPLFGRERDLGVIRAHLDDTLAGQGGLVLIGGEAGIGKTALAEAICREATECGMLVLVGRCYDLMETPPYGPWVDLFARYQRADGMPPLPPAFTARGNIGSVTNQAAFFRDIIDFFAALSAMRPVVLLLDDIHWADPASFDLLRVLARELPRLPLLLIATYRTDEVARGHPLHTLLPALVRETSAERVGLRPLDDSAVRALALTRYQLLPDDIHRLVAYVQARAEGNALFVIELLRALEEGRTLYQDGDRWCLGALSDTAVPALLAQVIDGRTARLDVQSQRLLTVAAVIGHDVPLDLWVAVAEVEETAVHAAGEQAVQARLLAETSDGGGVRFAHALIREALYEGIRAPQRRRLHLRAGELLAASRNPDPDAVAAHLRRAGDARAVTWLVQAGERAARASAWLTAADRFETAAQLADREETDPRERGWILYHRATLQALSGPDSSSFIASLDEAKRLGRETGDRGLAALAVYWRGELRCIVGERRRGLRDMEAGVAARRALTAAERAVLPTIPIPHTIRDDTDGESTLIQWLATVGRYAEAREIGERALADAQRSGRSAAGDESFAGDIHLGLAQAYAGLGLHRESRAAFALARRSYRTIGHDFMAGVSAANELRWVHPFIADNPAAVSQLLDEMDAAMAGTGESPSPYLRRFPRMLRRLLGEDWHEGRVQAEMPGGTFGFRQTVSRVLAPILRAQGDAGAAWALVLAALPEGAATEPGETWFPCGLTLLRLGAMLTMDAGDRDGAREWLEAHDRWIAQHSSPMGLADGALAWAVYHHATGDTVAAFRHGREALARAADPRQPLTLLAAHRLLGQLATDTGHFDDANHHLAQSLALADACAAPYERALTLIALTALHAATGQHAEATAALAAARTICERLGAEPALVRADDAAARLVAARHVAPAYPAGLTAREAEVLRLVATGRTNREIADALFLSPGTVNIHVTRIIAKTGSANRTEAAAFAHRHGLA